MKMISWNVNGLRACVQKGFLEQFDKLDADFFCLQETKMQQGQLKLELPGYLQYWNSAEKKGYSGTAVFTKHVPLSVAYGLGVPELDTEGRLITLEYQEFYLVNCYTPNAQRELARIDHRMRWDEAFREYIAKLDARKPVIICGDLNVAHKEIDLKNPASNRGSAGFSDQERDSFTRTLELGFTDTFRYLHPNAVGAYTWWSYMFKARQNNAGWRIDYFLVSDRLKETVYGTPVYSDIPGSDHCPVGLELDIPCNGSIWPAKTGKSAAEANTAAKGKIVAALKTAGKLGVLAVMTAGILFGVAKFRPAASLESERPVQADTDTTLPTETGREILRMIPCSGELTIRDITNNAQWGSFCIASDGETEWVVKSCLQDLTMGRMTPNCWIRLELTEYALRSGEDYSSQMPTVLFAESDLNGSELAALGEGVVFGVSSYLEDEGKMPGWFLYGYFPRNTQIILRFGEEEYTLLAEPAINKWQAEEMSTFELVDYAAHLGIFEFKSYASDSAAQVLKDYNARAEENPALRELSGRPDAGEKAAIFSAQNPDIISAQLLRQVFPWEPQMNVTDISMAQSWEMDTQLIVWYAVQDETLLQKLEQMKQNVWRKLCKEYPAYAELQKRTDTCLELLRYCKTYNGSMPQENASALIDVLVRYTGNVSVSERLQYKTFLTSVAEHKLESVSESDAKQMTTEELVALIAASHLDPSALYVNDSFLLNPGYSSLVSSSLPSSLFSGAVFLTSPEVYYEDFCEKYPAFRELEKRENAVSCLLVYCDNAGSNTDGYARAWFLLSRTVYLKKMTAQEAEAYLGKYSIGDPSKLSLYSLTRIVAGKVMPIAMKQTEAYADDPDARYLTIRDLFPVVAELERREDAAEELLSYASASVTRGGDIRDCIIFLLEQDVFRKQMEVEQECVYLSLLAEMITAEEAGQMKTAELITEIMKLATLRKYAANQSMYYEAFFKSGYRNCVNQYPVLAELETREDAASALLAYAKQLESVFEHVGLRLALWMLQVDVYRQQMTVADAQAYAEFAQVYMWGQDVTGLTTRRLLGFCLEEHFLYRKLSEASSPESGEMIFESIIKRYHPLAEVAKRADVVEELLLFCDSSNLSTSEVQQRNAVALLCLGRFYSQLTDAQQLKLAQYLLNG